ncbi:MAG: hypothetical protein WC837_04390 [Bellilinea sp.]
MFNYITLETVRRYIGGSIGTSDDDRLIDFIDWAARLVEWWKGRRYDVRLETRLYNTPTAGGSMFGVYDASLLAAASNRVLRLDEDLLEIVEIKNGDGIVLLPAEYVLEPANEYPKTRVRLRSGEIWLESDDGPEQAITLTGWWGYHDRYADAWRTVGAVQDAPLTAGATQVTLLDVSERETGELLRIEDELMLVEAVDDLTKKLTVERGINGTTAVQHAQATPIKRFRPSGTIEQICVRLVKWRYAQKDVDSFDQSYVVGSGVVSTPSSIPADVARILGAHRVRL